MDTTTLLPFEQKIIGLFGTLGITLYTFYYPNEYLAVLENSGKAALYQILADFTANCGALLSIAVGKKCRFSSFLFLTSLHSLRWKYCRSSENGIAFFDDMTLEILLSSISEQEKMLICKKRSLHFLMKKKSASDLLWSKYVSSRNQPEAVSSQKHSAVQAELHIYQKCRLNPRVFKDAVLLYPCLAVVIFLNPRHGFLCTHLPYPCTGLSI